MNQRLYNWFSWLLILLVDGLVVFVWGERVDWNFGNLSLYQWFPLFGLLAWMSMWTHYVSGAIRLSVPGLTRPRYYRRLTGYFVLGCLLLHPGLLAYAQFRNHAGHPPASFIDYVDEGLVLAVLLGTISLLIFLSFEVLDRLKSRPAIQHHWFKVSVAQSLAMVLIFVHGLRLGFIVNHTWFQIVWIACGILLIPCLYIIHRSELTGIKKETV